MSGWLLPAITPRSARREGDSFEAIGSSDLGYARPLARASASSDNRWAGFKTLRARWGEHIATTLMRPVLIIDEAQEMLTSVFAELRMLTSKEFDSRSLLCVVLAGDARLPERLRARHVCNLLQLQVLPREWRHDVA
ncbi:AAA family ATPase [Sorangium sp. So ce1128]